MIKTWCAAFMAAFLLSACTRDPNEFMTPDQQQSAIRQCKDHDLAAKAQTTMVGKVLNIFCVPK